MVDKPITDPGMLSAIETAPKEEPITDPDRLKQIEMEGSEPGYAERFVEGATRAPRAAMQIAGRFMPAAKPAQSAEATPKTTKFKQRPIEGFDPVATLGELTNPVPLGAAIGMARAASPLVRGLAGPIAGALAGLSQPVPEGTQDFLRAKTGQAAEGLAMGFGFSLGGKALSTGMRSVADWMVRNHPDNVMNRAVQVVLNNIARDEKYGGLKAQDAIDLIDTVNAGGPGRIQQPMRLADLGSLEETPGEAVKKLSGAVARAPGESSSLARSELKGRDRTAPDRMDQLLDLQVSSGPSVHEAGKILGSARQAAATPAYEALDTLHGIWSPRLAEFIGDSSRGIKTNPNIQKGLNHGYAIERDQALTEGRPFNPHSWGVDLDADGNVLLRTVPNMKVLDMAKRGLDKMVADSRDSITGKLSFDGRIINNLKNAYLAEIDSLDTKGLYKKARDAWAGPSASMDAMRLGQTLFDHHPDEIRDVFRSLSAGDKEFYKLGLADTMRTRIGKTGFAGDDAKAVVKNPWTRKQLREIFTDEVEFNKFADSVSKETSMFQTKENALGGSPSAERLLSDPQAASHGVTSMLFNTASSLAHGNWIHSIGNAYRMRRALGLKPDPEMNIAVAKILFSPQGTQLLQNPPAAVKGGGFGARKAVEDFAPYLAATTGQAPPPPVTRFDAQGNPLQ